MREGACDAQSEDLGGGVDGFVAGEGVDREEGGGDEESAAVEVHEVEASLRMLS